jgi:hypothetical protein
MIIRGKDRGETGVVKRVVRSQNRVIVEGKNLVRHLIIIIITTVSLYFLFKQLCFLFYLILRNKNWVVFFFF